MIAIKHSGIRKELTVNQEMSLASAQFKMYVVKGYI